MIMGVKKKIIDFELFGRLEFNPMITIPLNPMIFKIGSFGLSWHGFWSLIGILVAVYLVARWGKQDGLDNEIVYDVAVFGIIGGIIGARIFYVFDSASYYFADPVQIFAVWRGGIGFLGSMIGGIIVGGGYARLKNYPVGQIADYAAPAMIIAHIIGRLGDIWNGEHLSMPTNLPWGWVFTYPNSPGRLGAIELFGNPLQAVHPVVVYEMIWNFFTLIFLFKLRKKLKPDGSLWVLYMFFYSIGRFTLQFLRIDEVKFQIFGLPIQTAHIVCFLLFIVSLALMVWKMRPVGLDSGVGKQKMSKGRKRKAQSRASV